MNAREGAGRMKQAGQWLLFAPSTLGILIWAATLTTSQLPGGSGIFSPIAIFLTPAHVPLGILGAVLWLASWIVEGFAKKEP